MNSTMGPIIFFQQNTKNFHPQLNPNACYVCVWLQIKKLILFFLLFMGLIAIFDTIHEFHYTILVNFYFFFFFWMGRLKILLRTR